MCAMKEKEHRGLKGTKNAGKELWNKGLFFFRRDAAQSELHIVEQQSQVQDIAGKSNSIALKHSQMGTLSMISMCMSASSTQASLILK